MASDNAIGTHALGRFSIKLIFLYNQPQIPQVSTRLFCFLLYEFFDRALGLF